MATTLGGAFQWAEGLDALHIVNVRFGDFDGPTPGSVAEPVTAVAEMTGSGQSRTWQVLV